jgi:hypothetical protein
MMAELPLTVPDLVCTDDMDLFAGETTSDLQTLQQDVFHILIEAPGSNPDDVTRGVGIERMLSGTENQLANITQTIDAQLQKDDRIDSSKTTLTKLPPGSMLPDGTPLPAGGYAIDIEIVAGTQVLGVGFSFTADGGLAPQ